MPQKKFPGLPARSEGVVGSYEDIYGEKQILHNFRGELRVLRKRPTVSQRLSNIVGPLVGAKIRAARQQAGLSLTQLCVQAGLAWDANAKHRMYEIEKGVRRYGIRFGTLYAIAIVLKKSPADFLPSVEEVVEAAKVGTSRKAQLAVKE